MGWKDRAVVESRGNRSNWRDRAEPELKYGRRSVATGEPHEIEGIETGEDPLTVSAPEAALAGGASGVTGGWSDELAGVVGAMTAGDREQLADPIDGSAPAEESFGDRYRRSRDAARDHATRAQTQHGGVYGATELAGDLLANSALGVATGGASLTPAGQGIIGGVSGLGRTRAELTDPTAKDLQSAGLDAGVSAGLGAGSSAIAQKLGPWLKARAARGIADAELAAKERAAGLVDSGIDSLRGAYGGEVQKGSRQLENIGREIGNVSPELQAAAKELADRGAVQAVRESVVGNTIENLPGQVSKIGSAKDALQSAIANREADIARKAAELLDKPIQRQLLPRLQTYFSRAVPIAASTAVGSAIGGWPGMVAGSVLGTGLSAAMGRPGTALANAAKHPAVRKLAWTAVEKTIAEAPEKLGQFANAFTRAKSPQQLDAILSRDPEQGPAWEATKLQLLNDYLANTQPVEDTNTNETPEE